MVRAWGPNYPLNGHIFAYGRTDAGKTWKLIAIVQYYHACGYKVFDLWGGKRKEGGFWCFPSDEDKLWFEYSSHAGQMSEPGPKEYKVNLMYPCFVNRMPKQLPQKNPRIIAKPFTLYFKDVEIEEISTITGALPNNAKNVWKNIKEDLSDFANGEDILDWFDQKGHTKFKVLTLYNSFVVPFCRGKILMGKNCKYNLDLKEEAEDREAITILMDEYIDEEFKMFFILYFMQHTYNMAEKDIIHRKSIGLFRELNYFMKVQDESGQDAEQKQIMRNHFSNTARYGRSGFFVAGDTQSPAEVKGLVEGQDDLLILNEMPSPSDRERACDQLVRDGRMTATQRDYLGSIQMGHDEKGSPGFKGKMVVVERGRMAKLIQRAQPPRTRCFKVVDGNFNKVWKNIYNEYTSIMDILTDVTDIYANRSRPKQEEAKAKAIEKEKPMEQIIIKRSIPSVIRRKPLQLGY